MSTAIFPGIPPRIFQTELTESTGSLHNKRRDFSVSTGGNNHREHREKWYRSVNSVVDQFHSDSFSKINFENNKPQMDADKRRYIHVTEFVAQSNGSTHRKGRKERKAQLHKFLYMEAEIPLPGTRISRIGRIYTDNTIRAHPRQPLRLLTSPTRMAVAIRGDPCSIINNLKGKISYQWLFYPVIEQGVAQWI